MHRTANTSCRQLCRDYLYKNKSGAARSPSAPIHPRHCSADVCDLSNHLWPLFLPSSPLTTHFRPTMSAHTPPVKWAQRKDSLFLTIDIPDVKDSTIELTASHLVFKCVSNASQRARCCVVMVFALPVPWGRALPLPGADACAHPMFALVCSWALAHVILPPPRLVGRQLQGHEREAGIRAQPGVLQGRGPRQRGSWSVWALGLPCPRASAHVRLVPALRCRAQPGVCAHAACHVLLLSS